MVTFPFVVACGLWLYQLAKKFRLLLKAHRTHLSFYLPYLLLPCNYELIFEKPLYSSVARLSSPVHYLSNNQQRRPYVIHVLVQVCLASSVAERELYSIHRVLATQIKSRCKLKLGLSLSW